MSFAISKVVGWIYTLGVLAATILAARRVRDDAKVLVWLAILILATLRSPFLPQAYAGYPPIWLLTLLAATTASTPRTLGLVLAAWIGLNVFVPLDARWISLIVVVPQTLTIGLAIRALRR